MAKCELCGRDVAPGSERRVEAGKLISAVQAGYDPHSGSQTGRPAEQLRKDFMVLLEMHGPAWIVCDSCRAAIESYAEREPPGSPRHPELIRILGNGFQPKPEQWRIMLGGWLEKWEQRGVDVTVVASKIQIEQCPKTSLEEFIEVVPKQREMSSGQLVEDFILQDPDAHVEMAILAVWSLKDSPEMKKMMQRRRPGGE